MRIRKNETVAGARTMFLFVYDVDGNPVEPTAVTAADVLYDPGTGVCVAGAGTLAPSTKPLVVADFTFTADAATDQIHRVAHTLKSCDGPFTMANAGGGLPGGTAALTNYWVIPVDADNFKIASSLANAIAGIAINITTNGTGVQTMSDAASTARCIRGKFDYTFTQAETNVIANHIAICVERADLRTVMQTADVYLRAHDEDANVGGRTYGDLARCDHAFITSPNIAFPPEGGAGSVDITDPDTGTVRATIQITATGRGTTTLGDLT